MKKHSKEIMGSDFFGCEEIENAFNIKITLSIPAVPFSIEELKQAKKNNQFLILRVDKTAKGEILSIEKMHSLLDGKLKDGSFALFRDYNASGERKDDAWYQDEYFATKEAPKLSWALVCMDMKSKASSSKPKPVEIIYDYLVYFQNTGRKLLRNTEIKTSCIHSNGMTVFIADFPKEDGLYVGLTREDRQTPRLGSYLSITKL